MSPGVTRHELPALYMTQELELLQLGAISGLVQELSFGSYAELPDCMSLRRENLRSEIRRGA